MIETSELSKDYGSTQALRGVSIEIPKNEVVGLLGPNGAGKTTLMKILTGYLHPSSGHATIDGINVLERPLEVQARIGYLPENAPVYRDMLVQEYLEMIAELREVPRESERRLIGEAVERTGLQKFLARPISQLSKGYRQRVGLAQAILHKPRVLILDEPTTGLDPSQIVEIRRLIKELAENATVLLSTHILPEVEITCERVLIISEGTLRTDAQLEELSANNGAVVAIEAPETEAKTALAELSGVTNVSSIPDKSNGYRVYKVTGSDQGLCPAIFDLVKSRGWRLSELRPDRRNLETIFRSVAEAAPASQSEGVR